MTCSNPLPGPPYPNEHLWSWRARKAEAKANGMSEYEWQEQERPYLDWMRAERGRIAAETGQMPYQVSYRQLCDEQGGAPTCPVTELLNDMMSCGVCGRQKYKRVPAEGDNIAFEKLPEVRRNASGS